MNCKIISPSVATFLFIMYAPHLCGFLAQKPQYPPRSYVSTVICVVFGIAKYFSHLCRIDMDVLLSYLMGIIPVTQIISSIPSKLASGQPAEQIAKSRSTSPGNPHLSLIARILQIKLKFDCYTKFLF